MAPKEANYKLNLSGRGVSIKDRVISEDIALKIISLAMGGRDVSRQTGGSESSHASSEAHSSGGDHPNPKAFMAQKRPSSELERITCLAYYLTHHRQTPAFKTKDLTKLNTDAAQPSFSNPSVFARNAVQAEWLSLAGGGNKQITAFGEAIVEALPDREKVKTAIENQKSSRKRRAKKNRKRAT